MKKPSDPHTPVLKWNSARSPVIILPFVPSPVVGVCPHISWLQTPSLRSNSASGDPLAGTPSESANDPVCARRNDLSSTPPPQLKSPFQLYSDYFATCVLLERP